MRTVLVCAASCIVVLILGMAGCREEQNAAMPGLGPAFAPVPGWREYSQESTAGALPYRVGGCLPGNIATGRADRLPEFLRVEKQYADRRLVPLTGRRVSPAVVELALPPHPMQQPAEVLLAARYASEIASSPALHSGPQASKSSWSLPPELDDGPDLDYPLPGGKAIKPPSSRPMAEILVSYTPDPEPSSPESIPGPEFGMAEPHTSLFLIEPDLLVRN